MMPVQRAGDDELSWITPTYPAVHRVLTHPSDAGAYVYGRTRRERRVDDDGRVRTRARELARADWQVLIVDHHPGYIDWATYEANQARIGANTRPRAHEPGTGAVREGTALLQGLATCGRCGRRLAVHYQGTNSTPGYHCANRTLVNGRGARCLSVGGAQIDREAKLAALADAEAELARRDAARPRSLTDNERVALAALAADIERVWSAPTTADRDRKELLRTLLQDVRVDVNKQDKRAELLLRWRGGATTELVVELRGAHQPRVRTDEDTIDLLRRLAVHYPDATIAGILNRQGRRSATGQRFTATIVQALRHHWKIPRYQRSAEQPDGERVTVTDAAKVLGVAASTVHRWLNDGFIAGEQLTPGAPWRIRMTDELRARFVDDTPPGWLAMLEATRALGVSRQTVLQRVKRGELEAVHVRTGRRKGLRIKVNRPEPGLFEHTPAAQGAV